MQSWITSREKEDVCAEFHGRILSLRAAGQEELSFAQTRGRGAPSHVRAFRYIARPRQCQELRTPFDKTEQFAYHAHGID